MFEILKMATSTYVKNKLLHDGSDILINQNTDINVFMINKSVRNHAKKILNDYFNNSLDGDFTENEAALMKLGIFFANAESTGDEHLKAVLLDGIEKIRKVSDGKIRGWVSLEVLGQVGA